MSEPSSESNNIQTYDVAVIGGGIQGVGVAQAAVAAGYSVLLLEKTAWAAGTSSNSSKLIHGGLRYLQNGDFGLVRESLRERGLLLKNAPDLVHANWFYIPIYKHSRYRPWKIATGLSLYWLLSGHNEMSRFEKIPQQQWSQLQGLDTKDLQAVYRYQDAQTDDALLTAAVAESAHSLGATTLCPAELMSAQRTDNGYQIHYRTNTQEPTQEHACHCRFLVNAGGPWAEHIQSLMSPSFPAPAIELVQGSHLVLDQQISEHCFYLEAPSDGRAVFVLPWYNGTLLGTTETVHHGKPELAGTTDEERQYLLSVLERYFPNYTGKVVGEMAGLRVLPQEKGRPFRRSREVQLVTDSPKKPTYLGIYGGKLTVYRANAEKIMKVISKSLGAKTPIADTKELRLNIKR